MIGERVAHYQVTEKIGQGGMGEVYRATDTRLKRDVALKVLPESFTQDAQRAARFRREAEVLASLNHPNIGAIYGLEDSGTSQVLVLELIEGETLADRIARGPIPLDDAVNIALQIAEALEAAHEKGIIHRDLKPANVKIKPEGQVKVLDFGLAKAISGEDSDADMTRSPTLSVQATRAGVILGTAAYMSPEQARGRTLDRRTDIWSFGCILFEMLCGQRAFSGETVPDTMARILERAPDLEQLPPAVPVRVRHLLGRCLTKEVNNRTHDIADVRIEIQQILAEPWAGMTPEASPAARAAWLPGLVWLAAGLILGAAAVWLFLHPGTTPAPLSTPLQRTSVLLPAEAPLSLAAGSSYGVAGIDLALSPDGRHLAYVGLEEGVTHLYLRDLQESFAAQRLPETERVQNPFFSPDGKWIAFFTEEHLKKIPVQGGQPTVLCEARVPFGPGSWTPDGWIYFVHHEISVVKVRAEGGNPEPVRSSGNGLAVRGRDVSVLPGGKGLLLASRRMSDSFNFGDIVHLSLETGVTTILLAGGFSPHYVPSGHLLFSRGSDLYGVAFDLDSLEIRGSPVRLLEGIWTDSIWGVSQYTCSRNGTLAYIPGGDWSLSVPTWIDAQGRSEALSVPPRPYGTFELSPNGQLIAIQVTGILDQIHVYDSRRQTMTRLTPEGQFCHPVWTPDGGRLAFATLDAVDANQANQMVLTSAVGGVGSPQPLWPDGAEDENRGHPAAISPDGKHMLLMRWQASGDIHMRHLDGSDDMKPFLASSASEWGPQFSPYGRWVAYISDRTGPYEIFVRPFPEGDREWQVSAGGGEEHRWAADGRHIFYRRNRRIMKVPISVVTTPGGVASIAAGSPEVALEASFHNSPGHSYAVSPDGKRFLVNRPVAVESPGTEIRLITGWQSLLDRAGLQ